MRYTYPCLIERDMEELNATGREAYVITFRDVPGAVSGGWSWNEFAGDGRGLSRRCALLVRG